jgi:3-dehydroquinate dehydratase-2
MPKKTNKSKTLPIYLLNGPNINMLGAREPHIYGRATLAQVEKMAAERAAGLGYALVAKQTNHEGELVEFVQEARTHASAVILNAAAYTHTSVALYDAIKTLSIPLIELHISNPHARESFRHHTYVGMAATGAILGLGVHGYVLAVDAAAHLIADRKAKGPSK